MVLIVYFSSSDPLMFWFRLQYTSAPFFETTIRYLGGLLSAYALSHDLVLLDRADELGKILLPVFNTTSGYPVFSVNTAT